MADWGSVQQGLLGGYQVGRSAGGTGLGSAISKVADALRQQRESGEEQGRKLQLLGMDESSKMKLQQLENEGKIKQIEREAELIPRAVPEWKPTSKDEAIEYEKSKLALKPQTESIVDETGKVVGQRPVNSVFQPSGSSKELTLSGALGILSDPMKAAQIKRAYPNLYKKAEEVVKKNLGEEALSKTTSTLKNPGKKTAETIIPKDKRKAIAASLMDTNW